MAAFCEHRQAPWVPLCEHTDTMHAGDLREDHIGKRVQYGDTFGVLEALRRIDEHTVQLLVVRARGVPGERPDSDLLSVGTGAAVRITGRGTMPDRRAP